MRLHHSLLALAVASEAKSTGKWKRKKPSKKKEIESQPGAWMLNDAIYSQEYLNGLANLGVDVTDFPTSESGSRGLTSYGLFNYWKCDEKTGCDEATKKTIIHYSIVETGNYPNGVHTKAQRELIIQSLEELNNDLGCVILKYIPEADVKKGNTPENGILIGRGTSDDCRAHVGRRPGGYIYSWIKNGQMVPEAWQEITLGINCMTRGTIQHEMFHSLGFNHEQNRPDREELLKIYLQNVIPSFQYAFTEIGKETVNGQIIDATWLLEGKTVYPLEVSSVMMYGQKIASVNSKITHGLPETNKNRVFNTGNFVGNRQLGIDRVTTTDALQFQWLYCRANFNDAPDPTKLDPSTATLKDHLICDKPDQTGVRRPFFLDRMCDGVLDCLDGSDEKISAGFCKEAQTSTPGNCCASIRYDFSDVDISYHNQFILKYEGKSDAEAIGIQHDGKDIIPVKDSEHWVSEYTVDQFGFPSQYKLLTTSNHWFLVDIVKSTVEAHYPRDQASCPPLNMFLETGKQRVSVLTCKGVKDDSGQASSTTKPSTTSKPTTTTSKPTTTTSKPTTTTSKPSTTTSKDEDCPECLPSNLKCDNSFIDSESQRIMYGVEADPNSWPWLVQLWDEGHFCGGSILNEEWIITAAHCVQFRVDTSFQIRAGSHSRLDSDSTVVIRNVLKVILYDDYNDDLNQHDIALLKIEKLEFNDVISPACFPHEFEPKTGQRCWTAGWGIRDLYGDDGNEIDPKTLRSVDLNIKEDALCQDMFPPRPQSPENRYQFHPGQQICSGEVSWEVGNKAVCSGDSGGPLVCADANNQPMIVGLAALIMESDSQCFGHSVWTDVAQYKGWIQDEISKDTTTTKPETTKPVTITPETGSTTEPVATTASPSEVIDLLPSGVVCKNDFIMKDEMQRILGGSEVEKHSWHWIASFDGICGGVVISKNWILTAAHCLPNIYEGWTEALIGRHNDIDDEAVQTRVVKKIIEHEDYWDDIDGESNRLYNDIALIEVDDINFDGKTANPVCMPKSIEAYDGKKCYVAGWGSTEDFINSENEPSSKYPTNLQSTEMTLNGPRCPPSHIEHSGTICASSDAGKNACNGDSGGPLICLDEFNQPMLVGLVSYGAACFKGDPRRNGWFAKVDEFYNWIAQKIGAEIRTTTSPQTSPIVSSPETTEISGQNNALSGGRPACGEEEGKTFGADDEIYWSKPCPVPEDECPPKGTMATWVKKSAKIMYKSDQAAFIKVNIPFWASEEIKDDEYIGFLQFSRVKCGNDFLDLLAGVNFIEGWYYFLGVDMFDYEAVYHWQYRHRHFAGRHSSAVIQFYRRRLSEKKDLGSKSRDSFFLSLSGTGWTEWGEKFNLETCISEGLFVGVMPINNDVEGGLEANFAVCAAKDKELGWTGA